MKQILLFLFISLSSFGFCQMPDIIVELNTDSSFTNYDFSCLKVIDERASKDNIGYVSRGIGKNNSKLILKGESTKILIQTIKDLLPKRNNKPELILIVKNILASENIGTQNQYGFCNAEIEFARRKDTSLYSLGTFYSSISEKSNRIKYSHGNRVLLALEDCLMKFNNSDWKNKEGDLIDSSKKDTLFDYKSIPPKGAYFNYNRLKGKSAFNSEDYTITIATNSKNLTTYKINFMGLINPTLVKFVSDGKELYVRTDKTHFIKSGSFGKYIYFQGKIQTVFGNPSYIKSIENTLVIQKDLTMGTVENVFFTAIISDPDSYGEIRFQNYTVISVVIDTENSKVQFVSDIFLFKITKQFPLMLKEYRKSRRKPADKRKVIEALNRKF